MTMEGLALLIKQHQHQQQTQRSCSHTTTALPLTQEVEHMGRLTERQESTWFHGFNYGPLEVISLQCPINASN